MRGKEKKKLKKEQIIKIGKKDNNLREGEKKEAERESRSKRKLFSQHPLT